VESGIEKQGSRHISQEVCPWNRFATPSGEEAFLAREGVDGPSLIEWMTMTQEAFSARFKGNPSGAPSATACCATSPSRWVTSRKFRSLNRGNLIEYMRLPLFSAHVAPM
jgi:hypothetical protein